MAIGAATLPLVTVFGSLHYDVMVEAPDRPRLGETLPGRRWWPKCGGKGGNQAVAAARAGVATAMIGAVGDDEFGRELLANLDRHGVDRRHVRIVVDAGSGMSVAIVDAGGDYGAVIVSGANQHLGTGDVDAVAGLFERTAVLVLQNEVPEAANLAVARAAAAHGVPVLLNAAPMRPLSPEFAAAVDIIVVNAVEAADLSGTAIAGAEEALSVARRLTRRLPHVVVTLGGDGLVYTGRDGTTLTLPAEPVVVESTHGAGDEFIGVFAARLASGSAIADALRAANHAAAVLVATPESRR